MGLMTRISLLVAAMTVALAIALAPAAQARNCGRVAGAKIVTHGGVSCRTAARIYRKFKRGDKLPRGWVCGLSAGGCSKGGKSFTFRFNY